MARKDFIYVCCFLFIHTMYMFVIVLSNFFCCKMTVCWTGFTLFFSVIIIFFKFGLLTFIPLLSNQTICTGQFLVTIACDASYGLSKLNTTNWSHRLFKFCTKSLDLHGFIGQGNDYQFTKSVQLVNIRLSMITILKSHELWKTVMTNYFQGFLIEADLKIYGLFRNTSD